ncbi:MAG TPA: acylneuraminate cytidylyltransferase family protein [Candidatus Eisenbacteria bacterium]|nr:acylneuraminate cytidylyltransferase family protein [Candidatus Eisenbacteria bacterium]
MSQTKTAKPASVVALVPMRHESERVPGKNYRLFGGEPLYRRIVRSLLDCRWISQIVIDTDSPVIMEDVRRHFPEIQLIERPLWLRGGSVPMNDVLLHDVQQVAAEYYLQTHSTNPLLRAETISRAIDVFQHQYPVYDSLFSVTRIQSRLWDGLARPINHNPAILLRTQDLPPIYEENSCLYLFTRSNLEKRHNRIGERPLMFEIDPIESWDIDDELDFRVAEFLYQARGKGS